MAIPEILRKDRALIPSLLSADFGRLAEAVDLMLDAGARILHIDVMDGHFVPNITAGPPVVAALAPRVHERGGYLDVHLMIEEPDLYVEDFAHAGSDAISVHVEACPHLHRTLASIRAQGCSAGVVLNPATDTSTVGEAVLFCDYVLAMSVNPGFAGQEFIPESLEKVRRLRGLLPEGVALEIDGGIGRQTIGQAAEAGANWFVAGSAVFGADDPAAEVGYLYESACGRI